MNRFRTKKKGKDEMSIGGRPSIEVDSSGPFRMFGKKKQQDDGGKRDVDLATVLPPSDDFRTSLLMTGLSARFSMLREQDDPNSKLGKASDDSVLSPRRHSRLALEFGSPNALHDIAEVESLRAPPIGRFDSFQSDDASSISGSVMGRSKPIEGNNLFGGRQKIYKLNAGSKGGMSGRALYGDDVAQSSFQKWRQAEKEREQASYDEDGLMDIPDLEHYNNYNKRRETNSTTSSAPSAGRDSTAATSVTSQPSSLKDGQSAGHLPGLERSVTRTRRLYEQGLTQDLQDHQSSALSRMDNLSRQRIIGSRTPDLTPPVPSPTSTTFGDRVASDKRPLLSKASAPNLRSFSPSAASQPQMPTDNAGKFTHHDQKAQFGASPPLSPPVSETEEHPTLPIQPNDRGKATALGMFTRPTQRYDESRYAERQQQLQYGRESPLPRLPSDQSTPPGADASRSSSFRRNGSKANAPGPTTFFDDSDDASTDENRRSGGGVPPQLTVERPNDQDHPAFRKSALPTPLSLSSSRNSLDLSGRSPTLPIGLSEHPTSSEDPTALGPNSGAGTGAGLSGLVRQHLRNDSGASSVYGPSGQDVIAESSPLRQEQNGDVTQGVSDMSDENDDFARHLANGARRVRERLTTFTESDNERSAPPTPPQIDTGRELGASRSGGLGILRPKSSRGSLFDKSEKERGRTKTLRTHSRKTGHSGASPSPHNPSARVSRERQGENRPVDGETSPPEANSAEKEDSAHSGLKAFRQARRELQRMKEQELQHRVAQRPNQERPTAQRGMSNDGGPPPALFNRKPYDDARHRSRSRAGSQATSERERSGSETSSTGRAFSRGPSRQRNAPQGYDDPYSQSYGGYSPAIMTDYDSRRSPMMSPPNEQSFFVGGFGGAPPVMSPSHSASALDTPNRWAGKSRDPSNANQSPDMSPRIQQNGAGPYTRGRSGSVLHGAASTPNLHGSPVAPPLPPINPRRKNGSGRPSDEGVAPRPAPVPYGASNGFGNTGAYSDETMETYRHHKQTGMLQSPPRNRARQPMGHVNVSNPRVPGGMI